MRFAAELEERAASDIDDEALELLLMDPMWVAVEFEAIMRASEVDDGSIVATVPRRPWRSVTEVDSDGPSSARNGYEHGTPNRGSSRVRSPPSR
jgi:hypothetical protein